MASSVGLSDAADKALKDLERSHEFHDKLVRDVKDRWDAYEGLLDEQSDAAQWQSRLHPPILHNIVETTLASLLDDQFEFQVRPAPKFYNPNEAAAAAQGARAHEILFRRQLRADRFSEFQRPFVLQAAVARFSVAKTFWKTETYKHRYLRVRDMGAEMGLPVFLPKLEEAEDVRDEFDGPTTECLDVRDFYWDEAATSIENAAWAADAVWMTLGDLRKLAGQGVYDRVDELEKPWDEGTDSDTERTREQRGRKKGRIEVLTIYNRETRRAITIGGRKVVLRERDWPFWHNQYPYVVASLQPFPFSLQGMSVVEKLMHLQEAAWDLMNHRHDGMRLLMNPIYAVRPDLDNLDALIWEPGALWPLEDPQAVQQLGVDPTPIQLSMAAESSIKQDMQNLAQTHPFTTTSEARNVGADTATEAALVANLAQRATNSTRAQLNYAYERIGCQRMRLNQQFVREPVYAHVVGLDDRYEVEEILPHLLSGDYDFELAPMSESQMRAERRSEATAFFQATLAAVPVLASMGVKLNGKKLYEEFLKKGLDIQDTEAYFSNEAQQMPPGQPGQPAGAPGPGGVTGPQSIDPAVSPSAQISQSPETAMQRYGAMNGGQNV